ncbi:MAG: class I SAM-dependent DNA methyltransferase [Planctomycetes bacterium]|nr:class I SAM-dependent DNA methyltransferase [Planctomycetota bacterium]
MRLTLSEIRNNAMAFAAEWHDAASERADAQSFWTELFAVFGIRRRSVASFEEKVRNLGQGLDRIDVFWAGKMLGEHKSRGENLGKAASQAFNYVQLLTNEGRHHEVPRYVVVSDFARIVVYDLESPQPAEPVADFATARLHENIRHFGFLSGYDTRPLDPEDPINTQAVEVLGELHDALERGGYRGHTLERFLVRVLFCLFADDTAIFDADTFKILIENTRSDGSDLGAALARLFKVLDTPFSERHQNLPDELMALPFVNGELFREDLGFAEFNGAMRTALLKACSFDWARISPAVFGSLFQSVMADGEGAMKRRQIGAHYTSERDIMKLIRSLFLDELQAELAACGTDAKKLAAFHSKLASLRFLDPACGCGNFLVVAYRELRLLELATMQKMYQDARKGGLFKIDTLLKINVDQMYGIEIEEWPARIAEVAMWLVDHQMNQKVGEAFGQPVLRLPLRKSAKIRHDNALQVKWESVLPAAQCSFVLGNPPFVGAKFQTAAQRADMDRVCAGISNAGLLDYVCAWYVTAAEYIRGRKTRCAFVSTNSITQGEQVGVLWPALFRRGIKIQFAHRTFQWQSEARGKAHVHVVIIGFGEGVANGRKIYDYTESEDTPTVTNASNISPYLINGPDIAIANRSTPLCPAPDIGIGNKPIDGGNYLFTRDEMKAFVQEEPASKAYFRPWFGAEEFINGDHRWCLWLGDATSSEIRSMPRVHERVDKVRKFRLASKSAPTRELAARPTRFHVENMPDRRFLAIPKVSSERRTYIPIGYMPAKHLASDLLFVLPAATPYHFGVLTSAMHMAWVRQVCGRLESRYRYSNTLVYNNFPWPQDVTPKHKAAVEAAAQQVLDVRAKWKDQTLADLYDPLVMPADLVKAHKALDRAVDKCYRAKPFPNERARVEYLFELYEKLAHPLLPATSARRRRTKPPPAP